MRNRAELFTAKKHNEGDPVQGAVANRHNNEYNNKQLLEL